MIAVTTTAQDHEAGDRLHLFTVDDRGLWEFRSRLSDEEFALSDVTDDEWERFHAVLAER